MLLRGAMPRAPGGHPVFFVPSRTPYRFGPAAVDRGRSPIHRAQAVCNESMCGLLASPVAATILLFARGARIRAESRPRGRNPWNLITEVRRPDLRHWLCNRCAALVGAGRNEVRREATHVCNTFHAPTPVSRQASLPACCLAGQSAATPRIS